MSIYSANRMGHAGSATVVANEAYDSNSFGNILYESQLNDNAFFEAIILHDLAENKALQEGTLLESEIRALNEGSVKDFFERMLERLRQFWEKIKGAIKSVIDKILAFVLKDGKKIVAEFKRSYKGSMSATHEFDEWFVKDEVKILTAGYIEDEIRKNKNNTDDSSKKADVIAKALGMTIGIDSCKPSEYRKEKFKEKTVKSNKSFSISEICDYLSNGSQSIKDLKQIEKETNNSISKFSMKLKKEEREAAKGSSQGAGEIIARISMLVSAYEQVTTITISAAINQTKANLKRCRKALVEAKQNAKGAEVQHNSANDFYAGLLLVEECMDGDLEDAGAAISEDPDLKEEIENIEADVDDEIGTNDIDD